MSPSSKIAARWALLVALVVAPACAGNDGDAGRPASLPRRIVSLSPALTEILFALDLGDRVVGVTDYCDYPPQAALRRHVGGYVDPSVEAILALEPDLVLVSPNVGNRHAALTVQRAGVAMEVVPAETLDDAFSAITRVAELAGVGLRGEQLTTEIRARLDRVRQQVSGLPRVSVLFCLERDPMIVAGVGTLPADLIAIAGGRNVIEETRYPTVNIEAVLTRAPEIILQSRMDGVTRDGREAALRFWARWDGIPAVFAQRVHVIDGTTAFRAGPRLADAAEQLAGLLHPEAVDSGTGP